MGISGEAKQLRPLTVSDIYHLVRISTAAADVEGALAPDRAIDAVVVKRPVATTRNADVSVPNALDGDDLADVWLVSLRSGRMWNITHGALDSSGFWAPHWSPDGAYLAMLSTRGGNLSPWIWIRSTRKLARLTTRAVDSSSLDRFSYAWVDKREILARLLPAGILAPKLSDVTASEEAAMQKWPQAWRGQTVTSSAIESGLQIAKPPRESLTLIAFTQGGPTSREIARSSHFDGITVSPDHARVAFFSQTSTMIPIGRDFLTLDDKRMGAYILAIADLRSGRVTQIQGLRVTDQSPTRWSTDGRYLAFAGTSLSEPQSTPAFFRCDVQTATCTNVFTPPVPEHRSSTWFVLAPIWTPGNAMVFSPRFIDRNATPNAASLAWYSLNLQNQMTPTTPVVIKESISPVFVVNDRSGTYIRARLAGANAEHTVFAANAFLRGIAQASERSFSYTVDGRQFQGCVLLPPGPDKAYPTVVVPYAGEVYSTSCHISDAINSFDPMNYQLLAARGYVVLFPSMPLPPEGVANDVYAKLSDGVLPAMDKLVQLGIADPRRFAVMGQSYGGYSTFGLIEQTNRFKAAIALAAISNLTSFYGTFTDARDGYARQFGDTPAMRDDTFPLSWAEAGQGNLGTPPWIDPKRYLQNSPLTYADRVQTPVLIMHGDNDATVPIGQSEEFFTALYRQGKRATFVRYWGEGHEIFGEANVKDMWRRIYGWLDRYDT